MGQTPCALVYTKMRGYKERVTIRETQVRETQHTDEKCDGYIHINVQTEQSTPAIPAPGHAKVATEIVLGPNKIKGDQRHRPTDRHASQI
jgi:hypothetical protein